MVPLNDSLGAGDMAHVRALTDLPRDPQYQHPCLSSNLSFNSISRAVIDCSSLCGHQAHTGYTSIDGSKTPTDIKI